MVASLSTSVPSQSKIASLFATDIQLFDCFDDIGAPDASLSLDRCVEILTILVLIELAGSANFARLDFETDNCPGHCRKYLRLHLGPGPQFPRRKTLLHDIRQLVDDQN